MIYREYLESLILILSEPHSLSHVEDDLHDKVTKKIAFS